MWAVVQLLMVKLTAILAAHRALEAHQHERENHDLDLGLPNQPPAPPPPPRARAAPGKVKFPTQRVWASRAVQCAWRWLP